MKIYPNLNTQDTFENMRIHHYYKEILFFEQNYNNLIHAAYLYEP